MDPCPTCFKDWPPPTCQFIKLTSPSLPIYGLTSFLHASLWINLLLPVSWPPPTCQFMDWPPSTCQFMDWPPSTCQFVDWPPPPCQFVDWPSSTCQFEDWPPPTCQYIDWPPPACQYIDWPHPTCLSVDWPRLGSRSHRPRSRPILWYLDWSLNFLNERFIFRRHFYLRALPCYSKKTDLYFLGPSQQ